MESISHTFLLHRLFDVAQRYDLAMHDPAPYSVARRA
jgi:hypothetical protein